MVMKLVSLAFMILHKNIVNLPLDLRNADQTAKVKIELLQK